LHSVCAVIITWNSESVVRGCLDSLVAEGSAVTGITVVDNASTDGTKEMIKDGYHAVTLIENVENMGFAAAANQGVRECGCEYVLLLNPDISFEPGFVGALADTLKNNTEAGSASPRLVRPDGLLDSAGMAMQKSRKAVDRGRDEPDTGRYDAPGRVFGFCGAAVLLRRAMLEDAAVDGEYFDESFFAYKEDIDLAWRADLLGWKALYVPASAAVHHRGWKVSGRKSMPRSLRLHSHKNRYLTIIKNDDPVNVLIHLPQILFYELKLFAYSLFAEPFLFGACLDIIRLLPDLLKKRRAVMGRRRLGPGGIRCLIG